MNITDSSAVRPCTSCQMCAAVCPHEAIAIRLDDDGFYRPRVDEARCIDCNLCTKVCYRFDPAPRRTATSDLEKIPLLAATAQDKTLLDETTSGGIADLLARELIAEGYTCIGVRYADEDCRAEHVIAKTAEECTAFRGSKYIQSYSLPAFRHLVSHCREERFAVFGTPCQIYAVARFLELRRLRDRCVLVDLFCHGCPSLHVWTKYSQEVKQLIHKPHFDRVDFRSKVKGWGNFYVVVVVVDGIKAFISSPRKDEFYTLFFSDQVLNEACSTCIARSTLSYADIRLGDFWGRKYATDMQGVSAVAAVTRKGQELMETIRPALSRCDRQEWETFLPWQSYGRDYHPDHTLRRTMLDLLKTPSVPLRSAVKAFYRHQTMPQRLKRFAKQMLFYFPPKWVAIIKSRIG